MIKKLKYITLLLILSGLILTITGELINSTTIVVLGAVLFGVGICMMVRTVNPDLPPPPPPENPNGQE